MTRFARRIAALLALAALAFAQVAVSAHACPSRMDERAPMASMAGECDELPNANLCERHCDYGASSVDNHGVGADAPALAPLPWRVERAPQPAIVSIATRPFERRIERPPLILFGALRI